MLQENINLKVVKKTKFTKKIIASLVLGILPITSYFYGHEHNLSSAIKISQSEEKELIKKTIDYKKVAKKADTLATDKQVWLDSQLIEYDALNTVQTDIKLHQK